MTTDGIRALTFDTGGTILDWHSGYVAALRKAGQAHGQDADWHAVANEIRGNVLRRMVNLGEAAPPPYNFDGGHELAVDDALAKHGLDDWTADERASLGAPTTHHLRCWPDFPPVLPKLRQSFICASFTILSYRLIIDTARANGLSWDAVLSCEGIGKYKLLRESYLTAARWLQLEPSECLMVACHNFDLDAARAAGFRTAFVRRPDEWGPSGPPDPEPNPACDVIADDFPGLARALGVAL
ncbi:HAD family hydrolase [Oceanibacterium hippocampi]|uniref:(S)-2-haloacid dehalogenase n=1 Tax=Oceanibacterium hippocampi TaxID=745714 RepID=A0A1Y5S2D8_9PROT|nr:HAD family hydrolase [Oceanibacterium hippocampi]SLN31064.1 hypothetical protein OCH7691_01101 [Oceanibacterium hippocampi]